MTGNREDRLKRLQRLRRVGVRQGARHIAMPPPKPRPTEPPINTDTVPLHFLNYKDYLQHPVSIESVIAGTVIENDHGRYFSFEARYPLAGHHGQQPLTGLLDVPMHVVAAMVGDETWHDLTWEDVLFVDLETTGLELAAGTVAFLIGVGYLDGSDFVVRQVFMRDFDEETALLHDLQNLFEQFKAVASFNGKTFDLPLLENRFILARLFSDVFEAPHFDLLHPARRVWRRRLDNCRLATLEYDVLGVERGQADIPGSFIPSLYRKYLVDGDARTMAGIFYHNEVDIVSMAALAISLTHHFNMLDHPDPATHFHPVDVLSVGLWQQHLGNVTAAEAALTLARLQALPESLHTTATTELAYLLKRQGRVAEAEALWQELAISDNALLALEELAKYYEWQRKDWESAIHCIDYALQLLTEQSTSWLAETEQERWEHRKQRVLQKLAKA